jgi:hypothetical protein
VQKPVAPRSNFLQRPMGPRCFSRVRCARTAAPVGWWRVGSARPARRSDDRIEPRQRRAQPAGMAGQALIGRAGRSAAGLRGLGLGGGRRRQPAGLRAVRPGGEVTRHVAEEVQERRHHRRDHQAEQVVNRWAQPVHDRREAPGRVVRNRRGGAGFHAGDKTTFGGVWASSYEYGETAWAAPHMRARSNPADKGRPQTGT